MLVVEDWGELFVVAALLAAAAGYARGAQRLAHRRAGHPARASRDGIWFAAGLGVIAVTLLGPLDGWSEDSFAVHMVQHELIVLVAAPLLVRGRPLAHWAWGLSRAARMSLHGMVRRRPLVIAWSALTGTAGACALHTAALWAWHVPAWFRAALTHPALHIAQHATFLAAALCFWWSVLRPAPVRQAAARGVATLFVTTLTTGALGALLTFAATPWFAVPGQVPPVGLSLLEDQQLGGLIMWIPGGTVYVAAALALGARALTAAGTRPAVARIASARASLARPARVRNVLNR